MRNNVTRLLDAREIPYTLHALPTSEKYSALEVAEILHLPPSQVYKTLVALPREKTKPILALVPAAADLNLKSLAAALGEKKVRLATQRQAETLTGLQAGGISPLALLHLPFSVVLDDDSLAFERITISAGARGWDISLSPQDILTLTDGITAAITRRG